jgi:riboflavin synthase
MFTGIIEEIGSVATIKNRGQSLELAFHAKTVLTDIKLGDSIAVNGVCLTVTRFNSTGFSSDVMPVTYQTTTLNLLNRGDKVNLERALGANGRFGGHIVTGHVDGIGTIKSIVSQENAWLVVIAISTELINLCVNKGSVALDGTSLTIVECGADWISVSLIPHTRTWSVLGYKKVGAKVNVECDILAKQLHKSVNTPNNRTSNLNFEFLQQHGFI